MRQSWPIFIPGYNFTGKLATFESSNVMWPEKPGSMKPAVECVNKPSRPSEDLPSNRQLSHRDLFEVFGGCVDIRIHFIKARMNTQVLNANPSNNCLIKSLRTKYLKDCKDYIMKMLDSVGDSAFVK